MALVSLAGITALIRQLSLGAATATTAANEAEDGSITGRATVVADGSASGGRAVQFSSAVGAPGTYKPSTATTGVPAGTILTTYTGPTTITTAGTIIENKYIDRYLTINAADVVIRRCEIVGGTSWAGAHKGLIDARPANVSNLLVEDCTIHQQVPNVYVNGIMGHHFTMQRCYVYHCVDGAGVYNNNTGQKSNVYVNMYANLFERFTFFSPDPDHASTDNITHNDGVQLHGGEHINIVGNFFNWFAAPASDFPFSSTPGGIYQSSLLFHTMDDALGNKVAGTNATATSNRGYGQNIYMSDITAHITNVSIQYNWFSGGGSQTGVQTTGPINLSYNRYDKTGKAYTSGANPSRYQIRTTAAILPTIEGVYTNVWDDTGAALALGNNRDDGIRTN